MIDISTFDGRMVLGLCFAVIGIASHEFWKLQTGLTNKTNGAKK